MQHDTDAVARAADDRSGELLQRLAPLPERLEQHRHPWTVQHLDFPHAGHSILLPFIPSNWSNDGNPAANAEANEQSWLGVRQFLQDAVAAEQADAEKNGSAPSTDS